MSNMTRAEQQIVDKLVDDVEKLRITVRILIDLTSSFSLTTLERERLMNALYGVKP